LNTRDDFEFSSRDSESEEERHLRIQNEMRAKLNDRDPETIILDISLPSNYEDGSEYIFAKDIILRNGDQKTIIFTFTKKKISGNVRAFTGPFHCWCISPSRFFQPKDFYFDIHGKIINKETEKPKNAFSGLGKGHSLKEKSEIDIASDRMGIYMDIMIEQTAPPAIQYFLTISETSFQVKDLSK